MSRVPCVVTFPVAETGGPRVTDVTFCHRGCSTVYDAVTRTGDSYGKEARDLSKKGFCSPFKSLPKSRVSDQSVPGGLPRAQNLLPPSSCHFSSSLLYVFDQDLDRDGTDTVEPTEGFRETQS